VRAARKASSHTQRSLGAVRPLDHLFDSVAQRADAPSEDAVLAGFERRSGVLRLTAAAAAEGATVALDVSERSGLKGGIDGPDLLAQLGGKSASVPMPSNNPVADRRAADRRRGGESAGKDWFGLSRPAAITPEMKTDLQLLSLRAYLDPKKFFKKDSRSSRKKVVPTFFEMGTVVAGAQDFYSSRIPNAQRTQHFVDGLVDHVQTRAPGSESRKITKYLKRKTLEVQSANQPAPKFFNKKRKQVQDASKGPGSNKKNKQRR
jgi:hypothetical protein